jgi:phosphoglycerate dehydrogenase-like enzyme
MGVRVLIATPLEPELVERLREVDDRLDVQYEPELLPPMRYPSDHRGDPSFVHPPRYAELVAGAEVLFGFPYDTAEGLAWAVRTAPGLRFVQGTAAGAGQQVAASGLTDEELARVRVTSAVGVHAVPLAEWTMTALLWFAKDLPHLIEAQAKRRWEHHANHELRGQTVVVVGVGAIGLEIARLADAFGMRVIGVKRHVEDLPHVASVHPPDALDDLVAEADAVVVTLPLTEETRGLISRRTIERMRPNAVFVNIGRGGVVDEPALIEALQANRIRAALDVFAEEPLPESSPLWSMPNVLISPHTMALSFHENERAIVCGEPAPVPGGRRAPTPGTRPALLLSREVLDELAVERRPVAGAGVLGRTLRT